MFFHKRALKVFGVLPNHSAIEALLSHWQIHLHIAWYLRFQIRSWWSCTIHAKTTIKQNCKSFKIVPLHHIIKSLRFLPNCHFNFHFISSSVKCTSVPPQRNYSTFHLRFFLITQQKIYFPFFAVFVFIHYCPGKALFHLLCRIHNREYWNPNKALMACN